MATLGWTTQGGAGNQVALAEQLIALSSQSMTENGIAQSMTVYVKTGTPGVSHQIIGAIYDSSKSLLGQTVQGTIVNSSFTSVTMNFEEPKPTLVSGESYYLVLWGDVAGSPPDDQNAYVATTSAAGAGYPCQYQDKYYGVFGLYPGTFSSVECGGSFYYGLNIYITYTTTGGSTTKAECEAAGGYWYNGTCNDTPYFEAATYASGYYARYYKRQMVGHHAASGDVRTVEVSSSGHVKMNLYGYNPATGVWLPINVNTSGCVATAYCASGGVFA